VAVAVAIGALAASVFHLGRPRYAFRAMLGLRTSWMSREILAFGVFAPLAVAYALASFDARAAPLSAGSTHALEDALGGLVAAAGLAAVACSVLVYHATRRPAWGAAIVGFKFFMTAVVLGLATATVTMTCGAALLGDAAAAQAIAPVVAAAAQLVVAASLIKLAGELLSLRHLGDRQLTALRRSAVLMRDDLRTYTVSRFASGLAGTALVGWGHGPAAAGAGFALLVAGELLERTLFFASSTSPGMPGGMGE
jgi:DMSO reductase anchor subunit